MSISENKRDLMKNLTTSETFSEFPRDVDYNQSFSYQPPGILKTVNRASESSNHSILSFNNSNIERRSERNNKTVPVTIQQLDSERYVRFGE